MTNALGQHNSGNLLAEMTFPATSMTDQESTASTSLINTENRFGQSVDANANSTELLDRLSDLVDGFVRLSHPSTPLPVNIENPDGWSIFECVHAMLSVAEAHGDVQLQYPPSDAPTCFPKY